MSLPLKIGDLVARGGAVFILTRVEDGGTDEYGFLEGTCIVSAPPLDQECPDEPGWIQAGEVDNFLRGRAQKCHADESATQHHPIGYSCDE